MLRKNFYDKLFSGKKLVHLSGLIYLLVLGTLALLYFRERMLQNDSVYYTFNVLQLKDYNIEHNRYCSAITQFIPILALKFGIAVKTFVKLYSVSFIVFFYVVFLAIIMGWKDYTSAFALLISSVLVVKTSFYLPVSEFYQGFTVAVLLWAYLNKFPVGFSKRKLLWIMFPLVCFISTFYFHPLNLLTIAFIIFLFIAVHRTKSSLRYFLILLLLFIATIAVKFSIVKTDEYESSHLGSVSKIISNVPVILHSVAFEYVGKFLGGHIPLFTALILLVGACIYYRKYFLLLFTLVAAAGFGSLVLFTLPPADTPFVLENYFSGLGLILALPLFIVVQQAGVRFQSVIFFLLFLPSAHAIYKTHFVFTERIKFIQRLCEYGKKFPEKRYLLNAEGYPWWYAYSTFSLPFETLINQQMDDPENPLTYSVEAHPHEFDSLRTNPKIFLAAFWDLTRFNYPESPLYSGHFHLPELGYRDMTSLAPADESIFNTDNVKISTDENTYKFEMDSFLVVPVKIYNRAGFPIPSLFNNKRIYLSYHLYNERGDLVSYDNFRSPLYLDIEGEFTHGVIIYRPKERGNYIAEIDFVSDNVRWWGLNYRVKIKN